MPGSCSPSGDGARLGKRETRYRPKTTALLLPADLFLTRLEAETAQTLKEELGVWGSGSCLENSLLPQKLRAGGLEYLRKDLVPEKLVRRCVVPAQPLSSSSSPLKGMHQQLGKFNAFFEEIKKEMSVTCRHSMCERTHTCTPC